MKDTYRTVAHKSEGLFKEKGSSFQAFIFPANDVQDAEFHIEKVKSDHPKARHHCYAYRLGMEGETFRTNDDGEPSGTAGRPILGQLKSAEITNVIGIVVRYFGGTKLGVSGLIEAYKESTRDAIDHARIVKKTLHQQFSVRSDYAELPMIMESIKHANIHIVDKTFGKKPELIVSIPLSEIEKSWNIAATHYIGYSASLNDLMNKNIEIKEMEIV